MWWDAFATEFFEDDASLTLSFYLEDGPKRYSECLNTVSPLNHIKKCINLILILYMYSKSIDTCTLINMANSYITSDLEVIGKMLLSGHRG